MPAILLGIALLFGLILAGRWFAEADPKTLVRALKWVLVAMVVAVVVFFAATGRLGWALATLPALVPWFIRMRAMARTAKNYSRMASGPSAAGGQRSEVAARFVRMILDHATGDLDGVVLEGLHAGRRLGDLALAELIALIPGWQADPESLRLLETFLDRAHDRWRERAAGASAGAGAAFSEGPMTRDEALRVLGLDEDAGPEEIKEAHHRLMAGLHPDHGGSTYLAAKINQARDVLLKPRRPPGQARG